MASLIFTYDLAQPNNSQVLTLNIVPIAPGYDISINWGDGDIQNNLTGTSTTDISHTYVLTSEVTVNVTFNTPTQSCKIKSGDTVTYKRSGVTTCTQFPTNLTHLEFRYAELLTSVPNTLPASITDLSNMFIGCKIFNYDISGWDTSNVTNMNGMFENCHLFNIQIGDWDISNVTNMSYMMYGCKVFNNGDTGDNGLKPLNWDTSSVTNMGGMFASCYKFNQNIDSRVVTVGGNTYTTFDTSSVTDMGVVFSEASIFNNGDTGDNGLKPLNWDTSSVTNMYGMFTSCYKFNQDISTQVVTVDGNTYTSWDVSSVTNMAWMMHDCIQFNQDLSGWDISNVATMDNMFQNVYIQRSIYDSMLTNWATLPVQLNVPFDAGITTQYTCDSVAEDSRNDILIASKGWVITDGGCISPNIYADMTFGVPDGGLGTEMSPFSKSDLDSYLASSVGDGDIINIRGHLELSDTEPLLFPTAFNSVGGPISVEFRGWEIETRGCPIIKWTFDEDYSLNTTYDKNTWWDWHVANNITATFKNFIIQSKTYFIADVGGTTNSTFKNVLFIANDFRVAAGAGGSGSQLYLGCTINAENLYMENFTNLGLTDCVLDINTVSVDSIANFYTLYTVTTINNFDSHITNTILTNYTPVITKPITSTLVLSDFDSFVSYYTNKNTMYYKLFNVSDIVNPFLTDYRNTNGYNNGLFNEPRLSYGAYSFLGNTPITPEVFPTSGVIGSFYFGGDYTNVEVSNNTLSVTMEPIDNNVSVSMNQKIKDKVFITLTPVDRNDYVIAQQSFSVDFVGKHRKDSVYPKFCECVDNTCTEDADIKQYNKPIIGGNPLIVDFVACAKSSGIYSNYTPIKYNWYFDYSFDPTISASTNTPYVTHTYCGEYLYNYDVRLCVDFAVI